ncbi:MAG: hypothetical protein QF489_07830, partial [Planctomycetota bacterium]|nr:hypothetical protein [Planctomycetota bacterium]
ASGCGADVDLQQLPLSAGLLQSRTGWEAAVGEGEDYELLVVCSRRSAKRALKDPRFQAIGLAAIGRIREGDKLRWLLDDKVKRLRSPGWDYRWGSDL